jgi:NTE family protein
MIDNKKRKTVGLVLGSGGDRGFAHVGIINVLVKNNIPIDYITGTSIGAIVGAYYALHLEIDTLVERVEQFANSKHPLRFLDFNIPGISLIKGKEINKFLTEMFGDSTFSDTKIPLIIGTSDIDQGEAVYFKDGRIIDAIIPSMAIPGVFPIVDYDGRHLVDGGLLCATPAEPMLDFSPDAIIISDMYGHKFGKMENYKLSNVLARVYKIAISNLSRVNEQFYGENFIVLKPQTVENMDTFTFRETEENIIIGEKEALSRIEEIKKICL